MKLIEGNIITINGVQCTFQFYPSADTAWLCFACNVLGCSATYPSPFANVHKRELVKMGCSIGTDQSCTWKIPTMDSRSDELKKLQIFRESSDLSDQNYHQHELNFMAQNGIRQLGLPRIGNFADRIMPEPLHLEINSWQHLLDVLYKESISPVCAGITESIKGYR